MTIVNVIGRTSIIIVSIVTLQIFFPYSIACHANRVCTLRYIYNIFASITSVSDHRLADSFKVRAAYDMVIVGIYTNTALTLPVHQRR